MDSYQIISNGVMLAMDREEVAEKFAKLFKLTPEKAAGLLGKSKVVLRSNLDAQTAEMYREKLTAIGVDVDVRHVAAAPPLTELGQAAAISVDGRYQKPASTVELSVAPVEKPAVERDDDPDVAYAGNRELAFFFTGSGLEYFRIWIVNLFLTVLTLGIYSAWAKVRTQQYFYGNSLLGDSAFQYLATPMQILRGRMIGVALLALYFFSQQFSVEAGLIALAALLLLSPALMVLGLSARMRFTAWRHVRFGFTKNIVQAYGIVSLPLLLAGALMAAVMLGKEGGDANALWGSGLAVIMLVWLLAFPYWLFAMTRFLVTNASYGNAGFAFAARPSQYYFLYYLKAPLLMLGSLLVSVALATGLLAVTGSGGETQQLLEQIQQQAQADPPQVDLSASVSMYLSAALAGVVLTVGYLLGISYLQAQQFNLRYNGMSLGKSVLSCELRAWPLLWLWLSNTVGIVLTLGLFIPWAKVRMVEYRLSCLQLYASYELNDIINTARKDNAVAQEVGDMFDVDIAL